MLTHLHVKNLALIREAEIDFTEGLNILTGETGAGKSIVIGSVSLALGGRVAKDMVRPGADYGLRLENRAEGGCRVILRLPLRMAGPAAGEN